jgi:hypothetical protein
MILQLLVVRCLIPQVHISTTSWPGDIFPSDVDGEFHVYLHPETPLFPTASKPSAFCTPVSPLLSSDKRRSPFISYFQTQELYHLLTAQTIPNSGYPLLISTPTTFSLPSPPIFQGAVLRVIASLGLIEQNAVLAYTAAWSSFPSGKNVTLLVSNSSQPYQISVLVV